MRPTDPHEDALRKVGRWEWVAFPDFGVACIPARIDLESELSTLRAEGVAATTVDGGPGVRFRVFPIPGDDRTHLMVEAPRAEAHAGDPGPRIRTSVTLGVERWSIELVLVAEPAVLPVTLGREALAGRFDLDPAGKALAGPPRLWAAPRTGGPRR